MDLRHWLETQKAYQLDTYGLDWDEIGADPEKLTEYTTAMVHAAFLELAEAQQETPWKPWGKVDRGEVWRRNGGKFVGELVDVLFFVANALGAAGCTDEELAERYAAKMAVNVSRQENGYDGFTGKCAQCNRALDEPGAPAPIIHGEASFCNQACLDECNQLNRAVLHGLGFSDARIDGMTGSVSS